MIAPTLFGWLGPDLSLVLGHRGPAGGLLLFQCSSGVAEPQVSQRVVNVEFSSLLYHRLFIDFFFYF